MAKAFHRQEPPPPAAFHSPTGNKVAFELSHKGKRYKLHPTKGWRKWTKR